MTLEAILKLALALSLTVGVFTVIFLTGVRSAEKHYRLRYEGEGFQRYSFKEAVDCYGMETAEAAGVAAFIGMVIAVILCSGDWNWV